MPLSLAIITTQEIKDALELSVRLHYHVRIRYEPQEKDVLTHINVSVKTTLDLVPKVDPSGNDITPKDYLFCFKAGSKFHDTGFPRVKCAEKVGKMGITVPAKVPVVLAK